MKYKKYDNFIILKEPRQYSISDYKEVRDKMVNMFKDIPSLISVYQLGSISCPGISDLDLVVVLNDSPQHLDYRNYYNTLGDRDRYILMHSPFIITKNFFKNIKYFFIPGDLKLLYGEDLKINNIPQTNLLEQIIVTEFVLGTIFTVLCAVATKVIKIRSLLCSLHALKYDFDVYGLTRKNFFKGWQLIDIITELRQNWFKLPEKEGIEKFVINFEGVPAILLDALTFINKNLNYFENFSHNNYKYQLKFGINKYIVTSMSKEYKVAVKKMFIASFIEKLPYSKLTYDITWVLSDYIIKIPSSLVSLLSGNVNSTLKSIIKLRNNIIENYLKFYKSLSGFAILLPPMRSPVSSLNIKWRTLGALKALAKRYNYF